MSATVAATPAVERSVRPDSTRLTVATATRSAKLGFRDVLSAFRDVQSRVVQLPSPVYTVKHGDTLSGICASSLRGAGVKPSRAEIMAVAKAVASANGIANPDRIYVGQRLDLSAAQGREVKTAVVAAAAPVPAAQPALPQGGGAIPPAEYGLAVLAEAISGVRGEEPARMQRMVEGATRITSDFGRRKNPFTGRAEYHSGIDVAAVPGAKVYPVRPGEVVFSGWQPGYGKVVIVGHSDGTETLYAHNQRNLVSRGQRIEWATPLARVGSTGDSTGPHVHFELRRNGRAINPHAVATASLEVAQAL